VLCTMHTMWRLAGQAHTCRYAYACTHMCTRTHMFKLAGMDAHTHTSLYAQCWYIYLAGIMERRDTSYSVQTHYCHLINQNKLTVKKSSSREVVTIVNILPLVMIVVLLVTSCKNHGHTSGTDDSG